MDRVVLGIIIGTSGGMGLTVWSIIKTPMYVNNKLVRIKTIDWYPFFPSYSRIDLIDSIDEKD